MAYSLQLTAYSLHSPEDLIFRAFSTHLSSPSPAYPLELTFRASWALSGLAWGSIRHPCLALGASSKLLSLSWQAWGPSLGFLGTLLDRSWMAPVCSWGALGRPSGSKSLQGTIWALFWTSRDDFECILDPREVEFRNHPTFQALLSWVGWGETSQV